MYYCTKDNYMSMIVSSYLLERKQLVNVLGVKSDTIDVPSGVPQDGNFSPLYFA